MRSELRKIKADFEADYEYLIKYNKLGISLHSTPNILRIQLLSTFHLEITVLTDKYDNSIYKIEYEKVLLNCSLELVKQYVKEFEELCDTYISMDYNYSTLERTDVEAKVRKKKINNILDI